MTDDAPDREVDLHGTRLADAVERVTTELRAAYAARERRLVLVHGVGNHNEGRTSPLARAVREHLKELERLPRSVIRRLEFGESAPDLANAGCVRVTLALEVAADAVRFAPGEEPRRRAAGPPVRGELRRLARETPLPDDAGGAVRDADAELRRRFGPARPPGDPKSPGPLPS